MLTAKPVDVFRLGERNIVVCEVGAANPNQFLGKELWFYCDGQQMGRIKVEGLSTASHIDAGHADFHYSGDEIHSGQLGEQSLISDGSFEDAMHEIEVS